MLSDHTRKICLTSHFILFFIAMTETGCMIKAKRYKQIYHLADFGHTVRHLHKQEGTVLTSSINKSLLAATIPPELLAGKLLSRETLLNESPNDTEQTKPIGFYKHDLDNLLLLVAVMGNVHFLELFFSILIQGFLSFAIGLEYCNYDKFFAVSKFKILQHLSLGSTFTGWVSQYLAFDAVYIVPLRFWHRLQVTDITQVHTNVSHKSHWWQNRHLYEVFLICLTYLFLKVFINQLYFNLPLQSA